VSVFLIRGDTTELVALKQYDGLDTSESTNMRAKFTTPKSNWNLEVIIDSSDSIAELNEENNIWNKDYSSTEEGFSTLVIAGTASGVLVIILGIVFLLNQRRKPMIEETVQEEVRPEAPQEKKKGPSNVSSSPSTSSPKKGPPPAKKKAPEISTLTPAEQAAASFAALDSLTTSEVEAPERVATWNDLPSGGEYDYTADGTFYDGVECGRWKLLEDGRFEKVE
jgi:hypothetical protein